jgi:hypothetical protein
MRIAHVIPEKSLLVACDGRVYRRPISAEENKQPRLESIAAPELPNGP